MVIRGAALAALAVLLTSGVALAQQASLAGTVRDQTGAPLPGVTVELTAPHNATLAAATDASGKYRFDRVVAGSYTLSFRLPNFADQRRDVQLGTAAVTVDAVMALALSADVVVTAKRTFANLADVENPAENLVGIAQSASQGAITARQLDVRPLMRQGEVLETVPGVIITQHSGEGKANQYFLRGFNLDHGSDFAMTVAGTPVNMPSHAHSQGYSDLNFLIPELVAGVQFSKGPYFADQGDFATAGASNINYATELDHPIVHAEAGAYGFGRALFAASPRVGKGHLLAAFEASTNDGPWTVPDAFQQIEWRPSLQTQGDSVNGVSITAMGYHGDVERNRQPRRNAPSTPGIIDRFGSIDPTDGGRLVHATRLGFDWQHGSERDADQGRRRSLSPTISTSSPISRSISTIPCTAIRSNRSITAW